MSAHDHRIPSGPDDALDRERGRHSSGERRPGFWTSRTGLAAIGFLLIAGFFLLSEHRAHALGYLPYLLILLCPLLHIFHGGHGGHGSHGGHSGRKRGRSLSQSEDEP